MNKVVIIIDGLADLPCRQFNNLTPLEAAETPNLDEFARKSRLGYMYSIDENYAPESDTAVISILGNNPLISARGVFEAVGAGKKINRGDLALRANFGTIDNLKNKRVIDRRAGRTLTTKEARQLAKAINQQVKLPVKFEFYPTLQHRGVLILKGGFSDNITNIDAYQHEKGKIWVKENFDWSKPLDDEENTEYTANIVNSFVDQSFKILSEHPINKIRAKRGLMPANIIFTRDAGIEQPKLQKFWKSMAIVNMPLEKGICSLSGMNVYSFEYPSMKNYDVYENLYNGLEKMISFAVKTLKRRGKKYDFCYIHFKEIDVPGHDNKPLEKKNMIEILDKGFFSFLKKYAEANKIKVIVTADHSTPCNLKTHTAHPVPVLFYEPSFSGDSLEFGEKNSLKGSFGKVYGKNLLKKTGFH